MKIPHRRNPAKANKTKNGAMVIYACIASYIEEHKWPPSLAELAEMSHYSRARIGAYLELLEARGLIERGQGARMIRLTERSA